MKARSFVYTLIGVLMFVTSCKDEFFDDNKGMITEGLPAQVVLGFKTQESKVMTRASQDEESENRVDNIYVFVFKSNGNVHFRKFCTDGDGLSYVAGEPGHSSGKVFFETSSLIGATIIGIANLTTPTTSTAYTVTKEDLDKIETLSQLKNMVMSMDDQSVSRGALFMMTGYAKDKSGSTVVTIPGTEGETETLDCTLQLERTDAKVEFLVTTKPKEASWTDFSFLPKTWTVKQVPQQSFVMEADKGDYADKEKAVYFSTDAVPFEKINRNEQDANIYTGGSFVFYMPENKKTPKNKIQGYPERDAWKKGEGEQREFINANDSSTYVEMTGIVSYKEADGGIINADVTFIVHLGYAKKADGSTDVNDYNTERNSHYKYNIIVSGVDDIRVEVENNNELRPGYEGDIVSSKEGVFEFDSHYDRKLIKLNPSSLGEKVMWSVNTPFSRGIHEIHKGENPNKPDIPEDMRDYRWIKFAVNSEYGVAYDRLVKYPGDQNYNDPYKFDGQENNKPSPYYTSEGRNFPDARLFDIEQLMVYLWDKKDKGVTEDIAITVFVDEYLYFNHPLTGQPGEENRSLWKLTADKEDRVLHIIVDGAKFSEDGNSSLIQAQYSFKQRSIQTIFNVDNPDLDTAWGLESKMETGRMSAPNMRQGNSTNNGRLNTLEYILGVNYEKQVKWTDVLGTGDPYELEGTPDAVRACLLRNRDLNGDNIIQPREIRWYLAAIDQLSDIYLGEYALDEQSRLYPSNPADRNGKVRWHYVSSSGNGNNDPWILWAEEGASRGPASGSKNDDNSKNTEFSYRCVRNLGLLLNKPDDEPQDLVIVIPDADGVGCTIDLSRMNRKACRDNFETAKLPNHNERDANNRPYFKFHVNKDCAAYPLEPINGGHTWAFDWNTEYQTGYKWINRYNWAYYQNVDPSPKGYRIPNQREMLIMTSRLEPKQWPRYSVTATYWIRDDIWGNEHQESKIFKDLIPQLYVCQTAFSLNGKYPYNILREGFLWNYGNKMFYLQNDPNDVNETGWIRPVKDVR